MGRAGSATPNGCTGRDGAAERDDSDQAHGFETRRELPRVGAAVSEHQNAPQSAPEAAGEAHRQPGAKMALSRESGGRAAMIAIGA